jgi:hypothetical protein
MRDRFLQLRFEGTMNQSFDKSFDIPKTAEDNTRYYMDVAKTLLHLQGLKMRDGYKRRFERTNYVPVPLSGRQQQTYDNITWLIDVVCHSQGEYDKLCSVLDGAVVGYREMVSGLLNGVVTPKVIVHVPEPGQEYDEVIEMGGV